MNKKTVLKITAIGIIIASGIIISNYNKPENSEALTEKMNYVVNKDINFSSKKNEEESKKQVSTIIESKDFYKEKDKIKESLVVVEKNVKDLNKSKNKNNEKHTIISKNNSSYENKNESSNQTAPTVINKGKSVYLTNANDTRKLSQESQKFYNIIMNTNGNYKCEYGWDEWDLIYDEFKPNYGQISYTQQKNFQTGAVDLTINCDLSRTNFKVISDYNDKIYNALKNAGVYDGMSEYDAVVAINNYICKITTYDINYFKGSDILNYGRGRCSSYAYLMQELCEHLNINCQYVVGTANGANGWGSHAWNRVCLNGKWYYIDTCWNDGSNNKYMFSENLWADHKL